MQYAVVHKHSREVIGIVDSPDQGRIAGVLLIVPIQAGAGVQVGWLYENDTFRPPG